MRLVRPALPHPAFTLAELLIALAILGVIATFTIPKVLQAQQDERWNAAAKEAAGTVRSAFELYKLQNGLTTSTSPSSLTPYLNYVSLDTSSNFNWVNSTNVGSCGTYNCFRLHNGAILIYEGYSFNGSSTTNAIRFIFDPDGVYTSANNPQSVGFFIYYDGRFTSQANVLSGTGNSGGVVYNPGASQDPSWFHWN